MPAFDQAKLETYLSNVLDAVAQGDKTTLRKFGQLDGFVNNHIRKLVWFVFPEDSHLILGPFYLTVRTMDTGCIATHGLGFRMWMRGIEVLFNKM